MFEPMLVILAPPVGVFAWVLYDLHRRREPREEPAPVGVAPERAASTWKPSISAPA